MLGRRSPGSLVEELTQIKQLDSVQRNPITSSGVDYRGSSFQLNIIHEEEAPQVGTGHNGNTLS